MVESSRQPAPGNRQLDYTVSLDLEPRLPRKTWSRKHFFFILKGPRGRLSVGTRGQVLGNWV